MKQIKIKRTDKIIIFILIAGIALAAIISAVSRRSGNITAGSSGDPEGAPIVHVSDFDGKRAALMRRSSLCRPRHLSILPSRGSSPF